MTREEGLITAVALCIAAIALLVVFLRLKSMQKDLDKLNQRTYECVSEMLFRQEQGNRRELDRRLEAMQEHLGLMVVVQPQKTVVVKKGNV